MKRATVVTELPASTSRDMDKFVVRLPDGLRAEVLCAGVDVATDRVELTAIALVAMLGLSAVAAGAELQPFKTLFIWEVCQ
ncbi:hypothetical protein ACM61L_09545 [Pseudomonas aeruginosa]